MLDLAIRHVPELQAKFLETVNEDFYRYYRSRPDQLYFIPLQNDNGHMLQYVSISPENREVVGYIGCVIDRLTRTAKDIEAIRFMPSDEFSADVYRFLDLLFNQYGIDKAVWDVVVGNPAEKYFDCLAEAYGINIVGTFHKAVMLPDGHLYDQKYYEFFKDDFNKVWQELGQDAPYLYKRGCS